MRLTFKLFFAIVLGCSSFFVQAQVSDLFNSFDCREHAELPQDEAVEEPEILAYDFVEILEESQPVVTIDTMNGWKTWSYVENYSFGKDRGALPMIADLSALHPFFRDRILELLKICKRKGIELAIVETYRTHAKQHEYKTMGKKYTSSGAGRSRHQYGLAIDVVPVVKGVAVWDNVSLWRKVGAVGEKIGLKWGGRWRNPYDPGHFEWTGGLTSAHLGAGSFPAVPKGAHYPCLEEDLRILRRYWTEWETSQSSLTRK